MHPYLRSTDNNTCLWTDWNRIVERTAEMDKQMEKEGSATGIVLPPWWAEATLRISASAYDDYDSDYEQHDVHRGNGEFESLSGGAVVAWAALRTRMQEREYPWLLRREENGKPVVTVAVTGTTLKNALHNIVNAVEETRAIMQIPNYDPKVPAYAERANENMRRRDRDNEHFVIFNSHKPYEIYRHSWFMPQDHSNVDMDIERLEVVQEEAVSAHLSVQ